MLHSIEDQGTTLNEEDIVQLERELGYAIPSDYARFLLAYNGGVPEPNCHDVQGTEGTSIGEFVDIFVFYSVANVSGEVQESYCIKSNWSVYRGRIPQNLFPIGEDGGGNQICISLYGEDKGSIWYWDHEAEKIPPDYSNCYKVADNFQALLDNLFEYDYENDVRIP